MLWIANFITAVGVMVLLPFFPLFLRDLGVEGDGAIKVWTGLIVGAAPFTAALMAGIWGAIGDQVGRRAMVIRATLGVTVFIGLMALATNPWHLLLLRIGQGCFSGFVAPSLTLASVIAPAARQGRASGSMQMALLAGSVAGPLIGAPLFAGIGFDGVALVCAGLSLMATILVACFVPEPSGAIATRPEDPPPRPAVVLRRAVADVRRVLADPRVQSLFLALLFVRLANAAQNPTLVLYVEQLCERLDVPFDPRTAGLVFAANPIAVLLTLPIWGRLADLWSPRRQLVLCISAGALFTIAQSVAATPTALFGLRFLTGASLAGVFPAGFALVAAASRTDQRGSAFGTAFSALAMGLAVGPVVAAWIDPWLGYRSLLVGCGLLLACAVRFALVDRESGSSAGDVYSLADPR